MFCAYHERISVNTQNYSLFVENLKHGSSQSPSSISCQRQSTRSDITDWVMVVCATCCKVSAVKERSFYAWCWPITNEWHVNLLISFPVWMEDALSAARRNLLLFIINVNLIIITLFYCCFLLFTLIALLLQHCKCLCCGIIEGLSYFMFIFLLLEETCQLLPLRSLTSTCTAALISCHLWPFFVMIVHVCASLCATSLFLILYTKLGLMYPSEK